MKSALAVCVLALCLPLAAEALPLCPGPAQAQNTQAQALSDYRIALAQLDRAAGRR